MLDTNTVLDWLVFGDEAAAAVGVAIGEGRIQWLATPRTWAELRSVLDRPLTPRWEAAREHALTIGLENLLVLCPEPARDLHIVCRDASDQVFVDLALAASPSLLLTRDRAVLALRRRAATRGVEIATARSWWLGPSLVRDAASGPAGPCTP